MRSKVALLPMLALLAFGCGTRVTLAPGVKYPLPISDKAPAFLFPVNLSHLGTKADLTALTGTVTAGILGKFKGEVIPGQPLFDLVGNLSWELAETIDAQVKASTWTMTGGAERIATALAGLTEQILAFLAEKELIPKEYKFKYIIAVHSHGQSKSIAGKEMLEVDTWGGVYDIETKQILAYITSKDRMPNDDKSPLATIPGTYAKIVGALLGK